MGTRANGGSGDRRIERPSALATRRLGERANVSIWLTHDSSPRASPDVMPQPFGAEQRNLAIDAAIKAYDVKVKRNLQACRAHNSDFKASPDVHLTPFESK